MNKLLDTIKNRRSTFPGQFGDGKIDQDRILQLLEAARWAPTHKMTEPWRFVVFGPDSVAEFIDELIKAYNKKFKESERSPIKLKKLAKRKQQVSHIIAIIMHRDPEERLPEIEEVAAVACAAQNIYLMMDVLDIVGYWGSGFAYSEHMRQFLKLQDDDVCLGYFFLGCKDHDAPIPERKRKDLEAFVSWYGEN